MVARNNWIIESVPLGQSFDISEKKLWHQFYHGERGGVVVEHHTLNQKVLGSIPTGNFIMSVLTYVMAYYPFSKSVSFDTLNCGM